MILRSMVTRLMALLVVTKMILVLAQPAFGQPVLPPPAPPAPGLQAGPPLLASEEMAATGAAAGGSMMWGSADYMMSWIREVQLPVLVTSSPVGTAKEDIGVLGLSTTSILVGGQTLNGDQRSGVKLNVGGWVTADKMIGVDVGYFITESRSDPFFVSSNGSTNIARPIFDVDTGKPSSIIIASPGVSSGSVAVAANFGHFQGAHFDLQESIFDTRHFRLKSLVGYRFLRYDDGVDIEQSIFPIGGGFPDGTRLDARDSFAAHNEFHGCEVGFQSDFLYERWSVSLLGKFAVGRLLREVNIAGQSVTTSPGVAPQVLSGGVLALSSNIGNHGSGDWVGAPELATNIGYSVTDNLKVRVGYTVLCLFGAARAAEHIDTNVNPNLFPPPISGGPRAPSFYLHRSAVWLQTINLGMELTF